MECLAKLHRLLQIPQINTDQKLLRCIELLCKDAVSVVREASSRTLDATIVLRTLDTVVGFTSWLPKHAYQLTNLTALTLNNVRSVDLELLPLQLQSLTLSYSILADEQFNVDLPHLTQLQYLDVAFAQCITGLTAHLRHLRMTRVLRESLVSSFVGVTSLTRLETVEIVGSVDTAEELLLLSTLTTLKQLSIDYCTKECYMQAADAWPQLPMLRSLAYRGSYVNPNIDDLCDSVATIEHLIMCATSVQSLTRLQFTFLIDRDEDEGSYYEDRESDGEDAYELQELPVSVGHHVHRLINRKELDVTIERAHELWVFHNINLSPGDLQRLTSLTALTSLSLGLNGMSDVDLIVLLPHLQQLLHLSVPFSSISDASLSVIKESRTLTELVLRYTPGDVDTNQFDLGPCIKVVKSKCCIGLVPDSTVQRMSDMGQYISFPH